jgi:hypothetical protein
VFSSVFPPRVLQWFFHFKLRDQQYNVLHFCHFLAFAMERPQSSPMGRGGPSFFFLISEYNTIEFDGSPVSSTLVTTTEI